MDNRSKIFLAVAVALCAAIFPYLAFDFFDVQATHGILSWDVLFVILALSISQRKSLWCIPFVVSAVAYALIENDISSYIFVGISVTVFIGLIFLPKKKVNTIIAFLILSLASFICDAAGFFYDGFSLYLSDAWMLASFFWWGRILFFAIPIALVGIQFLLARRILFGPDKLQLTYLQAFIILAVAFGVHCGVNTFQNRQPILQSPAKACLWQMTLPGTESKSVYLQENTEKDFVQWKDSLALFETERPTLMVLVESWGVNKSSEYTNLLLKPFTDAHTFSGIQKRKAAHTKWSEMEDFGILDNERATALPQKFKEKGFQTWFVHGYDGSFYNRDTEYGKFGFDSLLFKKDFTDKGFGNCGYGFDGICDTSIVNFIDKLMTDSVPKFIYWTTLDSHAPIEKAKITSFVPECKENALDKSQCMYLTLQYNALNKLAELAKKHPEYRFIIRGDHRLMGSAGRGFISSFYYKYVPIVILN